MRKFNRILAALLVLLVMSVAVAPTVARAKSVPADVYEEPDFKMIIIVLTVGSKNISIIAARGASGCGCPSPGVPGQIDAAPEIKCDLMFAPMETIIEALGGTFTWNAVNKTVTIVLGTKTIVLTIGSPDALVNGKSVTINSECDASPYLKEPGDVIMLPVRFIAEQLGGFTAWDVPLQRATLVFVKP